MKLELCVAALGCALASCGPPPMPAGIGHALTGRQAPEFHEFATNGWDVGLPSGPRTKVTVIDFWATWCTACQQSLPALEKVWRDGKDDGVMVIGVSIDDSADDATSRMLELRATFPLVVDKHTRVLGRFSVAQIPMTFVVDRHGVVRWAGRDTEELKQAVAATLAEK